jgi:cytochrome b561
MSPSRLPRYNALALTLHWVIAAVILFQLYLGLTMGDLPKGPQQFQAFLLHKSIGATILGLAAFRLIWRLFNRPPPLPVTTPAWQKGIAHATHWLLYLSFFVVPMAGWTMSSADGRPVSVFGLFTLPNLVGKNAALGKTLGEVHELSAYVLAALVTIHVGAALYHFFVQRDEVLARMLPFARWPAK